MTVNTLTIELTCNGKTLKMGPGQDIDITAVSGLESSEVEISTSDNALVDGASVDGKKIKPRPIHIEASFRSSKNNPENRAKVIKFFNPKYTGKALLKKIAADALVILLAVPRAAVRRTQNRDDLLEIFQCIAGFSYIFQRSFHILPYPPAFCKYFSSLFVIFSPFGSALMSSSQIPRAISRKTT